MPSTRSWSVAAHLVNAGWTLGGFRLFYLNALPFVKHGLLKPLDGSAPHPTEAGLLAYATRFLGGANGAFSGFAFWRLYRLLTDATFKEDVSVFAMFVAMHYSQLHPNLRRWRDGEPSRVALDGLMRTIMLGDFSFCVINCYVIYRIVSEKTREGGDDDDARRD